VIAAICSSTNIISYKLFPFYMVFSSLYTFQKHYIFCEYISILLIIVSGSLFFAEFPMFEALPLFPDGSQIIHQMGSASVQMRRGPKIKVASTWSHGSHHPCSRCGKVYSWRTNLLRHLRLECGKKPHCQCPYCPYVTSHKTTLQEHIRRKHKNLPNIL
jgi:hypothetical protein